MGGACTFQATLASFFTGQTPPSTVALEVARQGFVIGGCVLADN